MPETLQTIDTRRRHLNGVSVEGFETGQVAWARSLIESIGLPLDRVTRITYKPALSGGEQNVLGQCNQGTGEVTFYKSLIDLPEIAHLGTVVHELAHNSSPFADSGERVFTSDRERNLAGDHSFFVAWQSLFTNRYFNGYHKQLAEEFKANKIDSTRFIEETWAIMTELRYTNPKHLRQVESAQRGRIKSINAIDQLVARIEDREAWVVPFTEILTPEGGTQPVGIDLALLNLTGKRTVGELEEHIDGIKSRLSRKGSPFTA